MKSAKVTTKSLKEPRFAPKPLRSIIAVGTRVIDLNLPKYAWLRGYDVESRRYILQGMCSDD